MLGKVASAVFRRKTTVFSSGVSTFSRVGNMTAGPSGSSIFSMRSKENFTSSEVSGSPLLNFSPSRSVQV